MSKPKSAPVGTKGTKIRQGKHAKVVENQDYSELMSVLPPVNRKQRREAKRKGTRR